MRYNFFCQCFDYSKEYNTKALPVHECCRKSEETSFNRNQFQNTGCKMYLNTADVRRLISQLFTLYAKDRENKFIVMF